MKSNVDKRINYLIIFLTIVVIAFGYYVVNGVPSTYAVPVNPGDSYGTIPAQTTVYTEVSTENICKSFYVGRQDSVATGITNNFRNTDGKAGNDEFYMIIYGARVDASDSDCKDDKSKYTAYCIDPVNPGPDSTELKYRWERDLKPSNKGSVGKFDAGLTYIYQNAYPNKDLPGLSDAQNLAAVEIATRFLTYHYGFNYSGKATYVSNGRAFKYTTWYLDGKCDDTGDCNTYRFRPLKSSSAVLDAAIKLFEAAKDVDADSLWKHELKFSDTVTAEKTEAQSGGNFTKIVRGTLSGQSAFKGEDKEKSFVKNLRVSCDNDAIKCEILDEAGNAISPETYLNEGSDPLNYQVKITGNLKDMTAKNLKVKVEVDFFDNRDSATGMIAYSKTYGSNYQRMVLFADKTVRTMKQEFEVSMCDIDMTKFVGDESIETYFYNFCDSTCLKSPMLTPGDPAFDEDRFKEEGCCTYLAPGDPTYDEICAINCLKENWKNECCNGEGVSEYYVTEGIDKDLDDYNYDLCVIDKDAQTPTNAPKNDLAGNELKMAGQGVDNNRYCSVACIEDWKFELPGAIYEVRAGTYFILSARMEGTRTCVTNDIKYGSQDGQLGTVGYFLTDLRNVNERIVNAYNMWHMYNEMLKQVESTGGYTEYVHCNISSSGCCDHDCGTEEEPECCDDGCEGDTDEDSAEWRKTSGGTYSGYKYDWDNNEISGDTKNFPGGTWGDKTDISGHCCDGDTCAGMEIRAWDESSLMQSVLNGLASAEAAFNSAMAERTTIMQEIRACSSWSNEFKFDPILSYAYEEDYYMNEFIKDNNYFIAQSDTSGDSKSEYCQETYADDTSYECTGGSSSSSQMDKPTSVVLCELSDGGICDPNPEEFPKNQNIKLDETQGALYKPFTVFYTLHPNGEIKGEAVEIQNDVSETGVITRLGRVFPVRLTTPKGVYNYKFVFNQVGQYNDDDELGRLMNYKTSSVADEDEPEITVNSKFTHNRASVFEAIGISPLYQCTYEVYEDVCKCCGEDDFDVNGDGITSGSGGSSNKLSINEEGYLTYYYRPVSLTDPFPNSNNGSLTGTRPTGSNWTDEKGSMVYNKITELGEFAYEEPEYSYILTPSATANIRSYNRAQDASGGFSDFALSCNEYGYDCTSMFLDNFDQIVDDNATVVRNSTGFVHYKEEELKHDEGKVPTGVGPAMK